MKLRLVAGKFTFIVGATLAIGVGGCKTNSSASQVENVATATDHANTMVAVLDQGCAQAMCHNSGHTGKLPFTTLKKFADQTKPYYTCFQQNGCFDHPDTPAVAKTCWEQCLQSGDGLSLDGGVFQGAIRSGVVKQIAVNAHATSDSMDGLSGNAMPPSANQVTPQNDVARNPETFRRVAAWLAEEASNGYEGIRAVRPQSSGGSTGGSAGFTEACDKFSPVVAAQINDDYSANWPMFGCSENTFPTDPNSCLSGFADSQYANSAAPGVVVKVLRPLTGRTRTEYWMRSSADGRFVSTGNGRIEDLATKDRSITADGETFDPVYAPDNKMYAWPDMTCPQAKLLDPTITIVGPSHPNSGCIAQDVDTYRSFGADVNGDVLAVQGYTNANPGVGTADACELPGNEGSFALTRITNGKLQANPMNFKTPGETDYQISPSGTLLVGHMKFNGSCAYRIRVVRPDGHTIAPDNNATTGVICMRGEKANISYDGRFVTFHHFNDGSGAPQDQGAAKQANIFVYDLLTHRSIRATNMIAGNNAYYPHFRADGWIYFEIKGADGLESIAATNAALVLKAMGPN